MIVSDAGKRRQCLRHGRRASFYRRAPLDSGKL